MRDEKEDVNAASVPARGTATLTWLYGRKVRLLGFDAIGSRGELAPLVIRSLRIGRFELFALEEGVPLEVFRKGALSPPLGSPIVDPGVEVRMVVENLSDAPRIVQVAIKPPVRP